MVLKKKKEHSNFNEQDQMKDDRSSDEEHNENIAESALSEIANEILNERNNSESPIVFKLSDIHRAYTAKREVDSSEISVQAPHRTRFKEKLLKYLWGL